MLSNFCVRVCLGSLGTAVKSAPACVCVYVQIFTAQPHRRSQADLPGGSKLRQFRPVLPPAHPYTFWQVKQQSDKIVKQETALNYATCTQ